MPHLHDGKLQFTHSLHVVTAAHSTIHKYLALMLPPHCLPFMAMAACTAFALTSCLTRGSAASRRLLVALQQHYGSFTCMEGHDVWCTAGLLSSHDDAFSACSPGEWSSQHSCAHASIPGARFPRQATGLKLAGKMHIQHEYSCIATASIAFEIVRA